MPRKLRCPDMDKDDLLWEKLEAEEDKWVEYARSPEVCRDVANFILKIKPGSPEVVYPPDQGSGNMVYRVEYKDGSSVIMRVPIKGTSPFPEEKTLYEVATMRYVAAHTTIPIPQIYHHGKASENPTGLGPFIIMEAVKFDHSMSRALQDPDLPPGEKPVLYKDIAEDKLELLYSQMADIMLQLSKLRLPRIGSLLEGEDGKSIDVQGRPLIGNMQQVIYHNNAPETILPSPSQTYSSAHEWYRALGDLHMAQLALQHNDAIKDEEDARDKYVARQLYRNLAKTEQLLTSEHSTDPSDFRLFSEDFRPANVLLDKDDKVVAVIDWEFAYAAPAQCSFDPPWWLLIQTPESWLGGTYEWLKAYEPRLKTFIRVLEAQEAKRAAATLADQVDMMSFNNKAHRAEPALSQRMRDSWNKGKWWLNYSTRRSWAFDFIWWRFIDEKYFGPNEDQDYKARMELLTGAQKDVMHSFVARKMKEKGDAKIMDWGEERAKELLSEVLV